MLKNIAANYLGVAAASLAPVLALPWYVSLLGAKYWGLASFVWVLQALLGLVNAGLAQAIIREVSSFAADQQSGARRIASVLYGFERIYWGFSLLVGLLVAGLSGSIVSGWLTLGDIPVATGREVIYAASVIFVVQFPVSIYRSVLFGSGQQVKQNMVVSAFSVLRHVGAVFALIYVQGSIEVYLAWNVVTILIETAVTAWLSWKTVGIARTELTWDSAEMRKVLAITASLSVSVLVGVMCLQVDKLVLSWSLPVEQFGYYMIASTVSVGVLQVFTPITSAWLPRVVQMHERRAALWKLNLRLLGAMLALVVAGALIFMLAGKEILALWLRNEAVVAVVFPVLSILLVGTAMNAIYSVGYMNWVVTRAHMKILTVNATGLVMSAALLPTLIAHFQLAGAALGWLIINLAGMMLSLDWLVRGARSE